MPSIKYRDGQNFPAVSVKVGDTLPVGTEIDYDGNSVPLGWEQVADGDLIVSSTEPSGDDRRKVWLRHGNNLFNSSGFNWATGTTLEYTSIYVGVGTYTIFSPNMPVGINNVANFFILANKVTTGADTATNGVDKNNVRTVTSTDGYLTIANRASTGNNPYAPKDYKFMINSGSTALEYEDYIYDKTYILNENNVYEEFEPQNEVYSTEERVIGKWIDGKPIYRKVVDFGSLPNTTTKTINHNISNIEKITRVEAVADYNNGYYNYLPIIKVGTNLTNYTLIDYISTTQISIKSTQNDSSGNCYITIEYTKTTDV